MTLRNAHWGPWALLVLVVALVAAIVFLAPSAARAAAALTTDLDKPFVVSAAGTDDQPTAPHITAKAAIVVDMASGAVLYSRNADKQLEPASTTKMMTAILILEDLPLDKKVKVPLVATGVSGSALGLKRDETFTVEQLLYMMLVPSANDAAITLAVAHSGSVSAFVEKMNARAEKMGLKNTHFVNDCGLHAEGHYSSASDLAKIASAAMKSSKFRKIVSTREYTLPKAGGVTDRLIKTSNELLRDYAWVNGIKTGSTPWAGSCLAASATKDGLTIISVILGAKDEKVREAESKSLLEYGFDCYGTKKLIGKGTLVARAPLADPLGRYVRLVTAEAYSRKVPGEGEVTGKVTLTGDLAAPVEAGQVLGELDFTQGEAALGSVQLVAAAAVGTPSLTMILDHWRGPWCSGLPLMRLLAPTTSQ